MYTLTILITLYVCMYTGKGESVSSSSVRSANEATYKWVEDHTLTKGTRITALGKFPLPPA